MKQYASTRTLCEVYDTSKDFFLSKKAKGVFIRNIHFVEASNTIRWNVEAIEKWWFGITESSKETDDILNKIIPA